MNLNVGFFTKYNCVEYFSLIFYLEIFDWQLFNDYVVFFCIQLCSSSKDGLKTRGFVIIHGSERICHCFMKCVKKIA